MRMTLPAAPCAVALAVLLLVGAAPDTPEKAGDFILASTTSLRETGLLDLLAKRFETATGIKMKAVALGTGQALAMARKGEADAVIVHSRVDEDVFIGEGFGAGAVTLMETRFLVVGPDADPAKVAGAADAAGVFKAIADAGAAFVSRGDNSGTHVREKTIWARAGVAPDGKPWYIKSGTGMGQTLMIAREKKAYTLSDSATWAVFQKTEGLKPVFDRGNELKNTYRYIRVNEAKVPRVNAGAAKKFGEFLCSKETMAFIGAYEKEKAGGPLFSPLGCPELRK